MTYMQKFSILSLVFLALIFTISCSATIKNYIDGKPMPNSSLILENPETQIRMEACIARYTWERDSQEDEKYKYPHWLEIGDENRDLPRDTVSVGGYVKIVNPKRIEYTIKAIFAFKRKNEQDLCSIRTLYTGSHHEKTFKIMKDVNKNRNQDVSIKIYIIKGNNTSIFDLSKEAIFNVELLRYSIKEEDKGNAH